MTAMIESVAENTHIQVDLDVDIQNALNFEDRTIEVAVPASQQIGVWASRAYEVVCSRGDWPAKNELTIRLVEPCEITNLNREYRSKNKPTNVLSFPFESPPGIDIALLGDIVLCHEIVVQEAASENKSVSQHYAHMVSHGVLHLCGYDHECDTSAEEMETLESEILAKSGYPNPYL